MPSRRRDDGRGCVIDFVQIEGGKRREVSLFWMKRGRIKLARDVLVSDFHGIDSGWW